MSQHPESSIPDFIWEFNPTPDSHHRVQVAFEMLLAESLVDLTGGSADGYCESKQSEGPP